MDLKTEDELRAFIAYSSFDEIDDYSSNIKKELNSNYDNRNTIDNAVKTLNGFGIKCDRYSYAEIMTHINDDIKPLKEHMGLIDKYLKGKQEHCIHDWVYDGHDSHYDYYKCAKCGLEDKN